MDDASQVCVPHPVNGKVQHYFRESDGRAICVRCGEPRDTDKVFAEAGQIGGERRT